MTGDPRIDWYDWSGGREAMLRFGPDAGPVVIAALPLLEEANRTRAFVVAILRALAVRGIGSVLPDMPGQGESVTLLETVSLGDMQMAFAAAAGRISRDGPVCYAIGIRSGALIDGIVLPPNLRPRLRGDAVRGGSADQEAAVSNRRWHLSPQDGPALLRELSRVKNVESGSGEFGDPAVPVMVAGNLLSPAMLAELATATTGEAGPHRPPVDRPRPRRPPHRRRAAMATQRARHGRCAVADARRRHRRLDCRMRRLIAFPCAGETLIGSIDEADGTTGLLIVSGGNEIRSGAHRGMALLATALSARGVPVFRYDRRGVGDSSGYNSGYTGAQDDLIAAPPRPFASRPPRMTRIVGFGNCDAATTLALFGRVAGIDAIVLANPWVVDDDDPLPPAAAIRARYAERLRDPAIWRRALSGDIDIGKAIRGLRKIIVAPSEPQTLANTVVATIRGWGDNASVIAAEGDATAIAFRHAARRGRLDARTTVIPTDSHSFARAGDAAALEGAIVAAL